jgi:hypothetical protein
MDLVAIVIFMPFAIVAFFAGMFVCGIVGFIIPPKPSHYAPDPWGTYALIGLTFNVANFALLAYFRRQSKDWRIFHFSKATFLAIMVISYILGLSVTIWIIASLIYS